MSQSTTSRTRKAARAVANQRIEAEALRRCWTAERSYSDRLAARFDVLAGAWSGPVLVLDRDRAVIQANDAARTCYGDDVVGGFWQGHPRGRELRVGDETVVMVDVAAAARTAPDERWQRLGASQAALAHQIRTPLTVAGLSVEQIMATADDAGVHANLERVQRSLSAIERHISNALVFVRGELSETTSFSLAELAAALRDAWRPLLGTDSGWWRDRYEPEQRACGDLPALVSALTNLVENSLAIGGAGTDVQVRLTASADQVELSVVDDGPGMSAEFLARAREPFVSGRDGGTGLGLAITDAVVRAHGGSMEIHSAPAQGTRVTVCLPLTVEAPV
ncbi:MAG: HAMP domain-containing histidine kinase [Gammaproteobacteria bacterium]|nr:HAMP domain-containing histidine kinase [Gammaproteobacteria bacterium]